MAFGNSDGDQHMLDTQDGVGARFMMLVHQMTPRANMTKK